MVVDLARSAWGLEATAAGGFTSFGEVGQMLGAAAAGVNGSAPVRPATKEGLDEAGSVA